MAAGHTGLFYMVGVPHDYHAVAAAGVTAMALTAVGLHVRSKLNRLENHLLPEPKVSVVNMATSLVEVFKGLLENIIGHGSEKYLPLVLTTFLFILISNLSGLIPGFTPATESINTELAMALFVFVSYQFFGFREHGIHYLKQFTGGLPPKGFGWALTLFLSLIAVMMVGIELVGHFIRPISLSFRLWGNINGDHTLLSVFNGITPLFVPIVFMVLGVFVSIVQALVFSLLYTVYIKLAVSHDH